jgi:hypothetical protein
MKQNNTKQFKTKPDVKTTLTSSTKTWTITNIKKAKPGKWILNFGKVTKDKKEGTEVEMKYSDCNWSPKFVSRVTREIATMVWPYKKMDRLLQDRATELLWREIWENPKQRWSAKC